MITMTRKLVASVAMTAAMLAAGAGAAVMAPNATATPSQDANYVRCVAEDGLSSRSGDTNTAMLGEAIATDIFYDARTPLAESNYLLMNAPAYVGLTQLDADWLVNCATWTWLGYGPALYNGATPVNTYYTPPSSTYRGPYSGAGMIV